MWVLCQICFSFCLLSQRTPECLHLDRLVGMVEDQRVPGQPVVIRRGQEFT